MTFSTKHLSHFPFNPATLLLSIASIGKELHKAVKPCMTKIISFCMFWSCLALSFICWLVVFALEDSRGSRLLMALWMQHSIGHSSHQWALCQAEEPSSINVFLAQKPRHVLAVLLWLFSRSTPGNWNCTQYSRLGWTVDLCSSTIMFSASFSNSFPNNS